MTRQFDGFEAEQWLMALSRFEPCDVRKAMSWFVSEAQHDQARGVVLGDIVKLTRQARVERYKREGDGYRPPVIPDNAETRANYKQLLEDMKQLIAKAKRL